MQYPAQRLSSESEAKEKQQRNASLLLTVWPEVPLKVANPSLIPDLAAHYKRFQVILQASPFPLAAPSTKESLAQLQLHTDVFTQTVLKVLSIYGITIKRLPEIQGKALNLLVFYWAVASNGGYVRVTGSGCWSKAADALGFSEHRGNSQFLIILRTLYAKILYQYEQIFLHKRSPHSITETHPPSVAATSASQPPHLAASLKEPSPAVATDYLERESKFIATELFSNRSYSLLSASENAKPQLDYGKISSKRLKHSLESPLNTEQSYALNVLLAISCTPAAGEVSFRQIPWLLEALIRMIASEIKSIPPSASTKKEEWLGAFLSSPNNFAVNVESLWRLQTCLIILKNFSIVFPREDLLMLAANYPLVKILFLIANQSSDYCLSQLATSVIDVLSEALSHLPLFQRAIYDSRAKELIFLIDKFVEKEFSSISPITSYPSIVLSAEELAFQPYDYYRASIGRDFRLLQNIFFQSAESLVPRVHLLYRLFPVMSTARSVECAAGIHNFILIRIFNGPIICLLRLMKLLLDRLSSSRGSPSPFAQHHTSLYALWLRKVVFNENFNLADFGLLDCGLDFVLLVLERQSSINWQPDWGVTLEIFLLLGEVFISPFSRGLSLEGAEEVFLAKPKSLHSSFISLLNRSSALLRFAGTFLCDSTLLIAAIRRYEDRLVALACGHPSVADQLILQCCEVSEILLFLACTKSVKEAV